MKRERKSLSSSVVIEQLISQCGEGSKSFLECLQPQVSPTVRRLIKNRVNEINLAKLRNAAECCNRGD